MGGTGRLMDDLGSQPFDFFGNLIGTPLLGEVVTQMFIIFL